MLGSAKTNWPLLTLTSWVKGTSSFHVFHFCNFILIFAGCFYCQLVWWYMIIYQKRYTFQCQLHSQDCWQTNKFWAEPWQCWQLPGWPTNNGLHICASFFKIFTMSKCSNFHNQNCQIKTAIWQQFCNHSHLFFSSNFQNVWNIQNVKVFKISKYSIYLQLGASFFSKFSKCQNVQIFCHQNFQIKTANWQRFAMTRIVFFFKFSKRLKYSKCQSIQNVKKFKFVKFSKCQNFQICTVNCQRFAMTRIILHNTWPQLDFHHLSLHPFNRFTPSQESHPSTIKQRISFFSSFLQKIKRDDQVPHDDTDSGEAGEEVGSCSYYQICFSYFQIFCYF